MDRVYNFSAGPSMLPVAVLKKAQEQMLSYKGSGQSVMEMSHRSKVYEQIIAEAEARLRQLLSIPEDYAVLFMQGGATLQFAAVAMNLSVNGKALYINSGNFARSALKEAQKFTNAVEFASSEKDNYTHIPAWDDAAIDQDADYLHITTNNTIFGTKYIKLPKAGGVPLVADMSSNILSEVTPELDVRNYGLIYAGAQKNIGPAGCAIIIMKKDLLGRSPASLPTMLSYKVMAENASMYNTPACYTIYIANLVFEWLQEMGGVSAIEAVNRRKAAALYQFLDGSRFFRGAADKEFRSIMNVTFVAPSDELNNKFVKEAEAAGFVNLKGHRLVGGMRASIYNAMPEEGIARLIDFMAAFEKANG